MQNTVGNVDFCKDPYSLLFDLLKKYITLSLLPVLRGRLEPEHVDIIILTADGQEETGGDGEEKREVDLEEAEIYHGKKGTIVQSDERAGISGAMQQAGKCISAKEKAEIRSLTKRCPIPM